MRACASECIMFYDAGSCLKLSMSEITADTRVQMIVLPCFYNSLYHPIELIVVLVSLMVQRVRFFFLNTHTW